MRLALLLSILLGQAASGPVDAAFEEAARTYDIATAEALLPKVAADAALAVRTRLLCAELYRIEFEALDEAAVKERRELGKRIDAHAEVGLLLLEGLPETSEKFRIRADLIGATIRSNYRAGKMKGEMKVAVEEALRLDPANARAMVSNAKMTIFNPSASDSELRDGVTLLRSALQLDPRLEQAKLLEAHVLNQLGERDAAEALWEDCLRDNPACAPARRALETPNSAGETPAGNVK